MTICASPCYADPFYVTVQITAYLACAGIPGMRFRDWSRAGILVSFERLLLPKGSQFALLFACALF